MIDILKLLRLMDTACPVLCSVNLSTDTGGNLLLIWRWNANDEVYKHTITIPPDEVDELNLYLNIDIARREIREYHD